MMNNTTLVSYILINLDMFSRLPANTAVHKDRNNNFIITAKWLSYIMGAQTVANTLKGHTTEKLTNDLCDFFETILNVLNDPNQNRKTISIICRELKLAFSGLPEMIDGGIFGLIKTYQYDHMCEQLADTINFMKDSIDIFKRVNNITEDCPEIEFDDKDWIDAMSIVPSMKTEYVGLYDYYVNYAIPLSFNQLIYTNDFCKWTVIYCNPTNGAKIYLGAQPTIHHLTGRNDCVELTNLGVGAVLCMTKVFETSSSSEGYIFSPASFADWQRYNADLYYYHLPSSDYSPMHLETMQKGVEFINWCMENGISVYVHCKSGKSRSFLVSVGYFVKYLNYTSHDAIDEIKSKRSQAGFGEGSKKWEVLKMYEDNVISQKNQRI